MDENENSIPKYIFLSPSDDPNSVYKLALINGKYINVAHLPNSLKIYDNALLHTAPIQSSISMVDGENGILLYRGYPIEQLYQSCDYLEVAYLLIYGDLPSKFEYQEWRNQIMTHTFAHCKLNDLMRSFNYDAHPMGMFISSIAAMSTFHPEANPNLAGTNIYLKSKESSIKMINKQIKRIIGKATTIAANAYRHRIGRDFNLPQSNLGYAENFLYMLDCLAERDYRPHPALTNAMEKLFIIHAEHEINCSTATMRMISSTLVDPYSAIAGAAAALYGPLHGGANEAVLEMFEEIQSIDRIPLFLESIKNKEQKLMGFGHRIYKNYDPRAKLVKEILYEVIQICGCDARLLGIAEELERQALQDEYFSSRRLYPNVDYYSGLVFKAMGFPTDFFPLLFAIPRISGWLAHWREQLIMDGDGIWRPIQIYTGKQKRNVIPMNQRNENDQVNEKRENDKNKSLIKSDGQEMYKRHLISRELQKINK